MDEPTPKPLPAPPSPWIPPPPHHHHAPSCPLAGHLPTCPLSRNLHPYPPPLLPPISSTHKHNHIPFFHPNICLLPSPFPASSEAYAAVPISTIPNPAPCLENNGGNMTEEQTENLDEQVEEGEEEEMEAVYVMTDEWLDFFAKSEAKRRLQRKQKQKQRK